MSNDNPTELQQATDPMAELLEQTKQKILHLLTIYPAVSHTMIQCGIGTSTSPKLWKPILDELIKAGEVLVVNISAMSPHDRTQSYTVYHHKQFPYAQIRDTLTQRTLNTQDPSPNTPAPQPQPQSTQAA